MSLFDRQNDSPRRRNLGGDPKHRETCGELRDRLVERIFPADRVEYNWFSDVPQSYGPKRPKDGRKG